MDFKVAYKKIKRGSVIKVRDYSNSEQASNKTQTQTSSAPRGSRYPLNHYVRSLGFIGDKETENEVLLIAHDVPHLNFTDAVLDCLPPEGSKWTIPPEEYKLREDLRSVDVCSVDPPGCTDIDDALHYKDIGKEKCEVGVHIADVSYYVKPNTALDREAAKRGTTVYLCDRRIDMIPELLSSNLCSLIQGQDRLAFSAIWTMKKSNAEVLGVRFARTIINSKASLTYEKAQTMIDDTSANSAIHKSLRGLNNLAKKMKQKRLDRGALVLARADEIRFVEIESETHERGAADFEIQHKRMMDTNSMVEEFMLLANISVANKLIEAFPQLALLRRHPKPSKADLEDLIHSAKITGFNIDPENGKSLSTSLDKAKMDGNEMFNLMLRMIATRCMTPAAYFCSGYFDPKTTSFTHFGLAAELYTHFTSPIRRYADLIVHRLLASSIGTSELDNSLKKTENIQALCDQINYRHRMAQLASRASSRLHTILYIKSKGQLMEEAHIFFVRQNAVQILVPRIAYEFTYFLDPSEEWEFDPDKRTQRNTKRNVILRQFDKLKVHISITHKEHTRYSDRISFKIIEPPLDGIESSQNILENIKEEDISNNVTDSTKSESKMETDSEIKDDELDARYKEYKKRIRLDLSEKESSKPVIVVPGDTLEKYISKNTTILGPGLMRVNDSVVATKSGILKMRNNNLFWVDSHQKRYVAVRGECVIGIVRGKGSLHVRVDINSAEIATLSLLAFEGATKRNKPNLNVGDLVYVKVLSASKHAETELVCVNSSGKKDGLGVIGDKGGVLITLSIDTTRLLLLPNCDFLEKLGQIHRYEIAVGMNGRIWINSNEPSTIVEVANELRKFDLG